MKLVASSDIVGNPTVALRWCLVPEEIQYLKDVKVSDPHILLVVVNNKKEVGRQLIPVGDLMTYLSFNYSGENTVFATIVWHESSKKLRDYYLGKGKYGYENQFYDRVADTLTGSDGYGLDAITISVAKDFFAPEPAGWERRWVNLWFETKPKDQCQFRKRRILAYTIQPVLILLWIVITTTSRLLSALFFVVIRTRTKVKLSPIIHPFKMSIDEVWYESIRRGRNIYLRKKDFSERDGFELFYLLFHPIAIIIISIILITIDVAVVKIYPGWWSYLLGSIAASIGIIIIILIVIALLAVGDAAITKIKVWRKKSSKDKQLEKARLQKAKRLAEETRQLALEAKLKNLEKEFKLISCDNGPLIPKLVALPKEKRTIHLRFLDLKARVCKPFAG